MKVLNNLTDASLKVKLEAFDNETNVYRWVDLLIFQINRLISSAINLLLSLRSKSKQHRQAHAGINSSFNILNQSETRATLRLRSRVVKIKISLSKILSSGQFASTKAKISINQGAQISLYLQERWRQLIRFKRRVSWSEYIKGFLMRAFDLRFWPSLAASYISSILIVCQMVLNFRSRAGRTSLSRKIRIFYLLVLSYLKSCLSEVISQLSQLWSWAYLNHYFYLSKTSSWFYIFQSAFFLMTNSLFLVAGPAAFWLESLFLYLNIFLV